jgi:glycosyltransferase involved in cell wall biosynthesis
MACTGYGQQVNIFAPRLRDLGHEIIVSAFYGIQGAPMNWDGIKVLPGSTVGDAYGTGILLEHFRHERADLVLTLMDVWVLEPSLLAQMPVAHWLPVDCDPLSVLDGVSLSQSGAVPVAMSRFGESRIRDRGFEPQFVPHGLHPAYCKELPPREDARKVFQVGDNFVIGMNAANKDAFRKGMAEQMYAFARLNRKYPDTLLLIHGMVMEQGALDLNALAQSLEIAHAVRYVDQYAYLTGQIPVEHLVTWYRALDLYSGASLGEGFGIPLIEAQACEVPVVVTDASAMTENAGSGWIVPGEPFWNPTHKAWWHKPDTGAIYRAYEAAYQRGKVYGAKKAKARDFAMQFEPDHVTTEYWKPVLEHLEKTL